MSDSQEKMFLNIEEKNELLFKLKIRGSEKNPAVRLVFEDEECSYSISGNAVENENGLYRFDIPPMNHRGLKEGSYKSKVEVLVEGRMFSPLNFDTVFQAPIEVQSESLSLRKKTLSEMIEMAPAPVTVHKVSGNSFGSLDKLLEPGTILEQTNQVKNNEEIKDITIEEETLLPVVEPKKQTSPVITFRSQTNQKSKSQLDELLKPVPVGSNSKISEQHTVSTSGGSLKSLGELLKPIK